MESLLQKSIPVILVAIVVYYEMSLCLNFKQMGLGSIHNFPDLGTIIITDGDRSTCQLPVPNSSFVLGTRGCDFTLPVISPQAACAVGPGDDGGEGRSQGSPFWGRGH